MTYGFKVSHHSSISNWHSVTLPKKIPQKVLYSPKLPKIDPMSTKRTHLWNSVGFWFSLLPSLPPRFSVFLFHSRRVPWRLRRPEIRKRYTDSPKSIFLFLIESLWLCFWPYNCLHFIIFKFHFIFCFGIWIKVEVCIILPLYVGQGLQFDLPVIEDPPNFVSTQ